MSAALGAGALIVACSHSALVPEHPDTPAARAQSVEAAVADIVNTRCGLENHCHNIGPARKYDSADVCESKLQGTTASQLNTKDCPLGVDPKKLDVCLAAIRAEDCGSIFDSLERWNACRNGQICWHE
jgi:hypothetical protein